MDHPRFTVAIIGGGIAGLTLAIALGKYPDIEVRIYEAASKFGEHGVGIVLSPRCWDIYEKLGVAEEFLKYTDAKPSKEQTVSVIRRKSDQKEGFIFHRTYLPGQQIAFHRPDCQKALLAHLPPTTGVFLSKRLTSYQRDGAQIQLHFQDGTTDRCDVLVGADGYKSAVRRYLLQERAQSATSKEEADEILSAAEPRWAGIIAYRGVVPADRVRASDTGHSIFESGRSPIIYGGPNSFIVAYPIQHDKLINLATFYIRHELENTAYDGPYVSQASGEEFTSRFDEFEQEAQILTKALALNSITKWAIHTVKPMSTFVHGKVVLVGDAAHAMVPFLGAGAGVAIEDAYILATTLGHPNTTRETLDRALEVYDTIRRPLALTVQENSRKQGYFHSLRIDGESKEFAFANRTDREEMWDDLQKLGDASQEANFCLWGFVDSSYEEALRML